MGDHFREQDDFTQNQDEAENVPVFVIDAVDEAMGLLHALFMACEAIEERTSRSALRYLVGVVEEKIRPFCSDEYYELRQGVGTLENVDFSTSVHCENRQVGACQPFGDVK